MKGKQIFIIGTTIGLMLIAQACRSTLNASYVKENEAQPSTAISTQTPLTYTLATYYSAAMGKTRTYGFALPPGYNLSPDKRYPVIFLLHGGHGDATDWFNPQKGNALPTLEQLYAAQKLPPSIIITPDGNDLRGSSSYHDPQYFDGPNGKVSTAIGDELVKVIQSRYRTLPTPEFWAMGGLSSGAWGAVNIGLRHLNHFSILFSHSGYFKDTSGPQNSPLDFVKTLTPSQRQQLRIYMDVGKNDESLYVQQNQKFHQQLNQLKITNVLNEFPGKHSWHYWRQHLADSLTYVGQQWKLIRNS